MTQSDKQEKTYADISRDIVKRALAAYYMSPRPMNQLTNRFDLYEEIEKALKAAVASSQKMNEEVMTKMRNTINEYKEKHNFDSFSRTEKVCKCAACCLALDALTAFDAARKGTL